MTASEVIQKLLEFPAEWLFGAFVGLIAVVGGALGLGVRINWFSSREAVRLAKLSEGYEKQRATSFSEELATAKLTITNRDARIIEQERLLVKLEADIASARHGVDQRPPDLQFVQELKARVAKFDELRAALLGGEEELWKLRGTDPTPEFVRALRASRVKVIVVANLKGGVGKTTITINLAAHYAIAKNLRILVIDLDYQGSLTSTMLNAAKTRLGSNILADAMLGGEVKGEWLATVARDIGSVLPNTRLITCGQTFDRFENQTMLRWLVGDIDDDVRYRLANLILSPEVQNAYDIVLIDAPPRTSLGAINALCAGHALIIPTVPDSMSVEAVGRFLSRMSKLRHLAPALSIALVVPSLTQETSLKPEEKEALAEARAALANWSGDAYITEAFIRHLPTLAKIAGREVGYVSDRRYVRPAFATLGYEVASRVGLS